MNGVIDDRAHIEKLMPDMLGGTIDPGRLFDRTVGREQVPDGYRPMAERQARRVLVSG